MLQKTIRSLSTILIMATLCLTYAHGQEVASQQENHARHRIGGMIGHTWIPLGFLPNIEQGFLAVPTWGLAYDYRLAKRWSIGIHTELETATYVIEERNNVELERERPFKIVLATACNPWKSLVVEAGFGLELEKNENFLVYRLGAAYEIEISNGWDLAPGLIFDFKENIYTSLTFGLQVGKKF